MKIINPFFFNSRGYILLDLAAIGREGRATAVGVVGCRYGSLNQWAMTRKTRTMAQVNIIFKTESYTKVETENRKRYYTPHTFLGVSTLKRPVWSMEETVLRERTGKEGHRRFFIGGGSSLTSLFPFFSTCRCEYL